MKEKRLQPVSVLHLKNKGLIILGKLQNMQTNVIVLCPKLVFITFFMSCFINNTNVKLK